MAMNIAKAVGLATVLTAEEGALAAINPSPAVLAGNLMVAGALAAMAAYGTALCGGTRKEIKRNAALLAAGASLITAPFAATAPANMQTAPDMHPTAHIVKAPAPVIK